MKENILFLLIILLVSIPVITTQEITYNCTKALHKYFLIINPFPFSLNKIILLTVNFSYGTAYNNSLYLFCNNELIPFYILSKEYYNNTPFYKECTLLFKISLNAFSYKLLEVRSYNNPINLPSYTTSNNYITLLYNVNATEYTLQTPYFNIKISNSPRGIYFINLTQYNFTLTNSTWPFFSFSLLLNNGKVTTQLDSSTANITVLYNNTAYSLLNFTFDNNLIRLYENLTLNIFTPSISLYGTVYLANISSVKSLCLGIVELNSSFKYVISSISPSPITISSSIESMFPPPLWLLISYKNFSLLLGTIYNDMNFTALLANYLNKTSNLTPETIQLLNSLNNLLYLSENLTLNSLLNNLTSIMYYKEFITKSLINSVQNLCNNTIPFEKRLILLKTNNSLIIAHHINETTLMNNTLLRFKYFIMLLPKHNYTYSEIWKIYLRNIVQPIVITIPVTFYSTAPTNLLVDNIFNYTINSLFKRSFNNVTIYLDNIENLVIKSGNESYTFSNVTSLTVNWTLAPIREGLNEILVKVILDNFSIPITRYVNVTLPPILPASQSVLVNLTVKCVDLSKHSLENCIVTLINNVTNEIIGSNLTDANGTTYFYNVSIGSYRVVVSDGELQKVIYLNVYKTENVTIVLPRAYLKLRVINELNSSLPNILVTIYDPSGNIVFSGYTNTNGSLVKYGLITNNYTIILHWVFSNTKVLVGRTTINLVNNTDITLIARVYKLTIKATQENEPLCEAKVEITSLDKGFQIIGYTNSSGMFSTLLPYGNYRIVVSKGQYTSSCTITLDRNLIMNLKCSLTSSLWILVIMTIALWGIYSFLWHRYTSITYREREKYRKLLQRLEELYKEGAIDERLYNKLKTDYEEKLRKLGG